MPFVSDLECFPALILQGLRIFNALFCDSLGHAIFIGNQVPTEYVLVAMRNICYFPVDTKITNIIRNFLSPWRLPTVVSKEQLSTQFLGLDCSCVPCTSGLAWRHPVKCCGSRVQTAWWRLCVGGVSVCKEEPSTAECVRLAECPALEKKAHLV